MKQLQELVAFQLSEAFKKEVYVLVRSHPGADRDLRFRDQLFQAASGPPAHIAEGFGRRTPREFVQFLAYARGSITEAQTRLTDGVDRGHYTASEAENALTLSRRAAAAIAGLQRSLRTWQ